MLLTNKHFIIAIIIAPILAIIAYFAVDYSVSETPATAIAGQHYPLAAKSNCRYQSGKCTLKNGDIEFTLESSDSDDRRISFQLSSELPLQGVKLALENSMDLMSEGGPLPATMEATNIQQTQWQVTIATDNTMIETEDARLQLVVSLNDSLYYGETETTFIHYETTFPRDNFSAR